MLYLADTNDNNQKLIFSFDILVYFQEKMSVISQKESSLDKYWSISLNSSRLIRKEFNQFSSKLAFGYVHSCGPYLERSLHQIQMIINGK